MKDPKMDTIVHNLVSIMPLFRKKLIKPISPTNGKKINHSQFEIMLILHEEGKLSISDIGKKLLISKPNMTKLLNELIDEGFIERFPDTRDRRITNIDLTKKGDDFLVDRFELVKTSTKDRLSTLTDEQLNKLDISLYTLKEVLEDIRLED